MSNQSAGLLIIAIGGVVLLVGLLVYSGALSWFGRLPGDVRIEGESVRVYVPIMSMILISLVLTGVAYLIRRLL